MTTHIRVSSTCTPTPLVFLLGFTRSPVGTLRIWGAKKPLDSDSVIVGVAQSPARREAQSYERNVSKCRKNVQVVQANMDKRNMAQEAAKGFPRCSYIMRLLIKGTTRSGASRSTEDQWVGVGPSCSGPRQMWFERGVVVLQSREVGSACEKRATMRLERWKVPRIWHGVLLFSHAWAAGHARGPSGAIAAIAVHSVIRGWLA